MNKQEQQIAIAEWMGYVWYRAPQDKHFPDKRYRFLALPAIQEYEGQIDIWKQRADGTEKIIESEPWKKAQGVDYVPDYPNDLNAMHEAENCLKGKQILDYVLNVLRSTGSSGFLTISSDAKGNDREWNEISGVACWNFVHTSAPQRAEALCRTLWPERFKK